jgi:hypothetical protein
MLELVSSKVVSAVAVLVLSGSVLGFFAIERGAMEDAHFRDMCRSLGNGIDGLSGTDSDIQMNVTFGGGRPGLRLDASFRGDLYDIELRPGQVVFRQKGLIAVHAFVLAVHLADPGLVWNGTPYVSATGLAAFDSDHGLLKFRSGEDFVALRMMLVVSGEMQYHTFVHR